MNSLLILIIQIAVIIILSRVIGFIFRKIHQPQVVGEMLAGILLGPSVLGWLSPELSSFIFPAESLKFLNILSEIGLLLFMFIIGLEFDAKLLKGRGSAAFLIGLSSIAFPFIFGVILSFFLYPLLSSNPATFTGFALFLGASMSVTAFPVLARILSEKNLIKTKLGAITIACATVNDFTVWSILAVLITIVRSGSDKIPFWLTISGAIVFIMIMISIVRPLIARLENYFNYRGNKLTNDMLGLVLLLMFASAWTTEWLGIHALVGAFFMGAIMPRNKYFLKSIIEKLKDVTLVLLLPIFFALTGLHTSFGLISGKVIWFYFTLILAATIIGKLGSSLIFKKFASLSWRESSALGILLNTRGLMEWIILSIGLELGVISPLLFAIMVMMTLITTFMITPVFEWVYPKRIIRKELEEAEKQEQEFRVLIPVSFPSSGPALLKIASTMSTQKNIKAYALHLVRASDISISNIAEEDGKPQNIEALIPLLKAAEENQSITVRPLSFATRNAAEDIYQIAGIKNVDLIIMGFHKPVLSESILSGTVHEVIKNARSDVCVYLERKFNPYKNILVPFNEGIHDKGALALAHRIAVNTNALVTVLHIVAPENKTGALAENNLSGRSSRAERIENFPDDNIKLQIVESSSPLDTAIKIANQNYDLVVAGLSETWGLEQSLFSKRHTRLARECPASLLIFRKYISGEN